MILYYLSIIVFLKCINSEVRFRPDAKKYLRVNYSKSGRQIRYNEMSVSYKPYKMVIDNRLVTDQTRFKSEAGHRIFVCEYVIYEHPQLYFKPNMQFRSAVFGFRCGSANTRISLN